MSITANSTLVAELQVSAKWHLRICANALSTCLFAI